MNAISIDYPNGGRTITIRTGKYLDCSAHSTFLLACQLAEQLDVDTVIVDFEKTTGIRASGLGVLLMLRDQAEPLGVDVLLDRCNPEIRDQIDTSRMLAGVSHAHTPQDKRAALPLRDDAL